ncbi:multiple sugar transport system substrate-binding protein [Natronobacillus azotifigens]|uniref:Extracellular solute-binding protein n=1 Tax=Natronobacillus azotifigens TaxID=472978 RepID=A0A9J6RAW7_9BACI|nr:extracellular solute-binding protein [Natronobacillus azotifigens]MCZ0702460.1 extracellular solute-binding protein [Natronobacillus azotifigens]
MKKKSIAFLASALVTLVLLAGCGGDENTIQFWTPLTGEDGAYMDQLVSDYNDTDPEFPVNHVITSDLYTQIYTVLQSGSGIPDLTLIHADRVPSFANNELLVPMDNILSQQPELNEDNFLEEAWTAGIIDGTQYTVPLDIHGSAMYYNIDLMEEYGVTHWLDDDIVTIDEMLELEGQLEEGQYVVNDALLSWVALGQLQNFGGDVEGPDGEPTINTPEMRQVIDSLRQINEAGLMTPFGEDGYLMFQSGNVLFSTDGTWSRLAHAQVESLNFGITNVYSHSADIFHNRSSAHLFSMLRNEDRTPEKEEGIGEFLEYIREHSIEWAEAGQIVASREVIEDPDYDQFMQSFYTKDERQEESLHIYTYEHYPYVVDAMDSFIADIVHGEMGIEEGLEEMQRFVEDRVDQGNQELEDAADAVEDFADDVD